MGAATVVSTVIFKFHLRIEMPRENIVHYTGTLIGAITWEYPGTGISPWGGFPFRKRVFGGLARNKGALICQEAPFRYFHFEYSWPPQPRSNRNSRFHPYPPRRWRCIRWKDDSGS